MKANLSRKTAFLYCVDNEQTKTIENTFSPMGISVKTVDENDFSKPLSALVFGMSNNTAQAEDISCTIDEPMMILHGLDRGLLDKAITALRKNDVIIALKAITTPTNLTWSSVKVFMNLKAEREAFEKAKK